jgi:hypothetical protein
MTLIRDSVEIMASLLSRQQLIGMRNYWPEPYETQRETAVNWRLGPHFTVTPDRPNGANGCLNLRAGALHGRLHSHGSCDNGCDFQNRTASHTCRMALRPTADQVLRGWNGTDYLDLLRLRL